MALLLGATLNGVAEHAPPQGVTFVELGQAPLQGIHAVRLLEARA